MDWTYRQGVREISVTLQDGNGVLVFTDYQQRVRWQAALLVTGTHFVLRRRGEWRDVDLGFMNHAVMKLAEERFALDSSVTTIHVAYLPATN